MECIAADKFSGVREHIHQVTEQCQKTSMTLTHLPTHSLTHAPTHSLTHSPTHSPTHRIRHYSVQSQEMVLSYQLNKLSTAVTEQTTGIQLPRTRSRNERERETLCRYTGSAADVCKIAMIEVSHQLAQTSPHCRL